MKLPKMALVIGGFGVLIIIGLVWMKFQPNTLKPKSGGAPQKPFDVASGDTNNEVLRTVMAKQEKLENQNDQLTQENKILQEKGISNLKTMIQKTQENLEQKLSAAQSSMEEQLTGQKQQINVLENKAQNGNLKINEGDQTNNKVIGDVPDLSETLNTESGAADNSDQNKPNKPTKAPQLPTSLKQPVTNQAQPKQPTTIPYYTIPAGSTLNNVSLMTAVIGEVPVSGRLVAPAFPFKAIVGKKDLLAANGQYLPYNLSGMVIEGYSVGNMTLSCASIYVSRVLFVFNNGHYVVYPSKTQESATDIYPKNALGYLSDPFGNTCIPGKYITDAPRVLASISAFSAARGVGAAVAQAQTTVMSDATQTNSMVTGNLGKYAAGTALDEGSKQALTWYMNRVANVFDVIFIPASVNHQVVKLTFNVNRTIPIDLNKKGRTLRYENNKNILSANTNRLD